MKRLALAIPCACLAVLADCSSSDVVVANVIIDTSDAQSSEPSSDAQSGDAQSSDASSSDAPSTDVGPQPPDAQSSDTGPQGQPCTASTSCDQFSYCKKNSCSAPRGTCQLRPTSCDSAFNPVCACNGVAYWNDCLRQNNGVESASPMTAEAGAPAPTGKCSVPAACTVPNGMTCPVPGAGPCGTGNTSPSCVVCSHLVHDANSCVQGPQVNLTGECWVMPSQCLPGAAYGPQIYAECYRPVRGRCLDICEAISHGYESYPVAVCP